MYLLDTDHLTVIERGGDSAPALNARLGMCAPGEVGATIVSFEEQTRGWLAYMAQARSLDQQVDAYRRLRRHLRTFCAVPIVEFDEKARDVMADLLRLRLHVGTMDLRIAAIALATGSVLLSRNLGDFRRVPGLVVEDWTA